MSSGQSLAERAIYTLSIVSRMGDDLTIESPERHIVRGLKMSAEKLLENCFFAASDIAYQAEQISKHFKTEEQQ